MKVFNLNTESNFNQENLFGSTSDFGLDPPQLENIEAWDKDECLKHEKQLLIIKMC